MKTILKITMAVGVMMMFESNDEAKAQCEAPYQVNGYRGCGIREYQIYMRPLCNNVCNYDLLGNPYNCGTVCN